MAGFTACATMELRLLCLNAPSIQFPQKLVRTFWAGSHESMAMNALDDRLVRRDSGIDSIMTHHLIPHP
jgi:hypothetical protein